MQLQIHALISVKLCWYKRLKQVTKPNLSVPAFNLFQPAEADISHGLLIKTSPALVTNQPLFTGTAVDCPTGANVWLRQKSIVGPVKLNRHWFLCSLYIYMCYWNGNVILSFWWNFRHWKNIERKISILMKFSSQAALELVILTTSSAASDENLIKIDIFLQCIWGLWSQKHVSRAWRSNPLNKLKLKFGNNYRNYEGKVNNDNRATSPVNHISHQWSTYIM